MEDEGFLVHPFDPPAGVWHFDLDELVAGYEITREAAVAVGYRADPRVAPNTRLPFEGYLHPENPEFYRAPHNYQQEYWLQWQGGPDLNYSLQRWVELPNGSRQHYPSLGCLGRVIDLAFAADTTAYYVGQYYAFTRFAELALAVRELPEVMTLELEWAECMTNRGYEGLMQRADAPLMAAELYAVLPSDVSDGELDLVRERERLMALTDVACDGEVGYNTTRSNLVSQLVVEYATEHADEILAWSSVLDRVADRLSGKADSGD